ncbi:MAG: penicillin acylase family protein [Actinomycetes bacterium]
MRGLQMDTYNSFAATLVPVLLATSRDEGTSVPADARAFTREAVDLLRNWNYHEDADSPAAAYYNAVWSNLLHLTFADEPRGAVQPEGGSRWFEVVGSLLADEESPFWDDKRTPTVVEQRDQILGQAMYQARVELTAHLGKDPRSWRWGALHQLSLQAQPFSGSSVPAPVRSLFDIGSFRLGGGSSLVDANGWDASIPGNYSVNVVPSMRMVVDLQHLDASTWVDLTGVSGHPWSPHFSDQTKRWVEGEAYPWPFSRKAVEEAETDRLVLEPGPDTS